MAFLGLNADGLSDEIHHVSVTGEMEQAHMHARFTACTRLLACRLERERLQLA